jgi:hypothetical protein
VDPARAQSRGTQERRHDPPVYHMLHSAEPLPKQHPKHAQQRGPLINTNHLSHVPQGEALGQGTPPKHAKQCMLPLSEHSPHFRSTVRDPCQDKHPKHPQQCGTLLPNAPITCSRCGVPAHTTPPKCICSDALRRVGTHLTRLRFGPFRPEGLPI